MPEKPPLSEEEMRIKRLEEMDEEKSYDHTGALKPEFQPDISKPKDTIIEIKGDVSVEPEGENVLTALPGETLASARQIDMNHGEAINEDIQRTIDKIKKIFSKKR